MAAKNHFHSWPWSGKLLNFLEMVLSSCSFDSHSSKVFSLLLIFLDEIQMFFLLLSQSRQISKIYVWNLPANKKLFWGGLWKRTTFLSFNSLCKHQVGLWCVKYFSCIWAIDRTTWYFFNEGRIFNSMPKIKIYFLADTN